MTKYESQGLDLQDELLSMLNLQRCTYTEDKTIKALRDMRDDGKDELIREHKSANEKGLHR